MLRTALVSQSGHHRSVPGLGVGFSVVGPKLRLGLFFPVLLLSGVIRFLVGLCAVRAR